MELSNKTLSMLLVAAIAISILGTFFSLQKLETLSYTGYAVNTSQTGLTNLSIEASIGVVVSNVDFGSGGVGTISETLTTEQDNTGLGLTGWKNCITDTSAASCQGMNINNTGNVDVNITLGANVTGSSLFSAAGAADSWFRYNISNGSYTDAAEGCNGTLVNTWTNVPNNNTPTLVCANLSPGTGNAMHAEFNMTLDPAEPTGQKRTSVYVFAECIEGAPTC